MPTEEAMGYIDAAWKFIASNAFEPFMSKHLASTIVS